MCSASVLLSEFTEDKFGNGMLQALSSGQIAVDGEYCFEGLFRTDFRGCSVKQVQAQERSGQESRP